MAPPAITARYLTRFRCLGGSCEDTCCQNWEIPLDRRQHQLLKTAMDGSRAEREEFRAGIQRDRTPGRPEDTYARVRMAPDHPCPFLGPEKLCSIQTRYGERALPAVCSTFPRLVARAGERLEVWGALSCPELARQVLLHDDALELVDAPEDASPRWIPSRVLDEDSPYDLSLEEVRAAGLRLLSLREQPVALRLFLLAYLGKETSEFLRKDVAAVDRARLSAVIEHVADPATATRWRQELAGLPPPRALTANLVSQLITAPVQVSSFRQLLAATLEGYRASGGITGDPPCVSAAPLWAEHAARRQQWQEAEGPRLERYFQNYALSFWTREWHTSSIDLLAHARRLLVRVAVLRFLLFGHPALPAALALNTEARGEVLDRAAVEVFYKTARAVEHQGSFLDRIAATVIQDGMQTFAHSTFLTLV